MVKTMNLELKNLTLSYQDKLVLENISHLFEGNQIHAILGPNGSGKSTLIKAISGVKELKSGEINFSLESKEMKLNSISPRNRAKLIAVVPQNSFLGGALSVQDAVSLGRTPHIPFSGKLAEDDQQIIEQVIKQFELEKFRTIPISYLSGGEQQRVLLARAMAQETPILLLDEPTNHLDLKYQNELFHWLKDIKQNTDKIIIIAMHDINLASLYTDQIILLKNNKIYSHGTPQQTLTQKNLSHIYETDLQIVSSLGQQIILPKP